MAGGGWYTLLSILKESLDEQATRPRGASCPHDGEPYTLGADGELFCRFDGYRPAFDGDGYGLGTNLA